MTCASLKHESLGGSGGMPPPPPPPPQNFFQNSKVDSKAIFESNLYTFRNRQSISFTEDGCGRTRTK